MYAMLKSCGWQHREEFANLLDKEHPLYYTQGDVKAKVAELQAAPRQESPRSAASVPKLPDLFRARDARRELGGGEGRGCVDQLGGAGPRGWGF